MSESETDRQLHPDLHPLLLRFQALTGEPLESVWRVYDQQDLDRIILIFPRLALIIEAEPDDDTIKFDLANPEDLHTTEYSEASTFEPWSNCIGKHFSWGWLTINHLDALDGILLGFSENTPQVLLTVVASSIRESLVSLLTNHAAEEPRTVTK